ncbi:MAG TPA: 50S ribosomal protein L11 methyltransferase [Solirubrobacteraceae bacterium]|nr:50S ribosomal protein L11 methyltransferase [Solirubrobacteraceae bacterium]
MIRLAVRVRRSEAEIVLAELLEIAPSGVEEAELDGELVEYAVYGSPGELPDLPDLRAAAGRALVDVSSSEVDDDWSERWRRFHKPVLIGSPAPGRVPAIYVHPPWERPAGRGDAIEIAIDPGQAFGTGAHATTRLCLELLLNLTAERSLLVDPSAQAAGEAGQGHDALLDVGTGSGVLAIAAARLGYGPVLALDNDRRGVTAAIENAKANGAAIEARRFDLRCEALPDVAGVRAPVLLANLLRPLLLDLASALERSPEHLIAGGLLCEEVDEVTRAFGESVGLRERERRHSGEWAAVWLQADG